MKFCKLLKLHDRGPCQWIGFYMIGTSVMKELTTLNSKFTESEVKTVQICSINTEAGVPRRSLKMVFWTVSQNSQENHLCGSLLLKSSRLLADYKESPNVASSK